MLKVNDNLPSLLYITGSGRSGSTMLDHLLSGHPQISSLGEVHRFSMSINRSTKPHYCSCGKSVAECSFWQPVLEELRTAAAPRGLDELITTDPENLRLPDSVDLTNIYEPIPTGSLRYGVTLSKLILALRWPPLQAIASPLSSGLRTQQKIAKDSSLLFKVVKEVHGTSIVTDCTKTPGRLMALDQFGELDGIHVLYLVRNGLAVAAARMRRQGIPMRQAAQVWLQEHRKIAWAMRPMEKRGRVTTIKYEDLCNDPCSVLRDVAAALAIEPYDDWGLRVPKGGYHGLGGNPMRWRSTEKKVVLDDRWKNELSQSDITTFYAIAGATNRRLGYKAMAV